MTGKKLYFVLLALIGTALVGTASADLVGHWALDEGSGTTAHDASGNGLDGTLHGGGGWGAGQLGGAWQGNGSDSYIDVGNDAVTGGLLDLNPGGQATVAAWINLAVSKNHNAVVTKGEWRDAYGITIKGDTSPPDQIWVGGRDTILSGVPVPVGEWTHIAQTIDSTTVTLFLNGAVVNVATRERVIQNNPNDHLEIGREDRSDNGADARWYFSGMIDDVRIYNEVLSEEDLYAAMLGGNPGAATNPYPANEATDVIRDGVVLSWLPSDFAVSHDVYFGEAFEDVNVATTASPEFKGNQADTSLALDRLEFAKTYFWRIDEVNDVPDKTVFKGAVWRFEVEPVGYLVASDLLSATASSQNSLDEDPNDTINGVGLNPDGSHSQDRTTMWLSAKSDPSAWIRYDLSEPLKLSEMLVWNHNTQSEEDLNYGIMEAQISVSRDGIDFTDLGIVTLAQAAETSVDMQGAVAQSVKITVVSNYGGSKSGLSEIRLYSIPAVARELSPADGATNVDPTTAVLTWRAGREAGSHDVYLSTDEQAVIDGTAAKVTLPVASATPDLELGKTYYWRVDEVNNVEDPALWAGSVQSFSTADSIVVDDMESYKNEAGLYIYEAWADGYQKSDNGSLVGVGANFEAEKTIVHNGSQSLPMTYGDLGIKDSWATLTLPAVNWSKHGVKSLSLYFHGRTTNTAGQLYVKVNNTKFEYKGGATDILTDQWFPFTVDLAGVTTVNSLTIGVAGGAGMLLVDDIRLYPQASELVTPVAPGTANLQIRYTFEGNFNDSSGKGRNGTALGAAATIADPTRGQVLSLDGADSGVSVPLASVADEVTIAMWINVADVAAAYNSAFMSNGWEPNAVHTRIGAKKVDMGVNGLANLAGKSIVAANEWIYVSYTVKHTETESITTVWLNGIAEASATTAVNPLVGRRTVWIGNGTIGSWLNTSGVIDRELIGMIDDVVIYDRALSANEIAALAGRTAPLYKPF